MGEAATGTLCPSLTIIYSFLYDAIPEIVKIPYTESKSTLYACEETGQSFAQIPGLGDT